MSDFTRILCAIDQGDPAAAEQLLPLVCDELRKLAAQKMAQEKPGQTLQATALVHEAYVRLVDTDKVRHWESRGHFFASAAEAMRRILVDSARRKKSAKRSGTFKREELDDFPVDPDAGPNIDALALDEALDKLAEADPLAANFVRLRYFAGLTTDQTASVLGMSTRNAYYTWTFARSWLRRQMSSRPC